MRTVKEISDLTGISVRTLHYYDEIGLLKPTEKSDAGYRLYDDKALETLQQILFFREFDISLKEIKAVLDNPALERNQILQVQRKMLVTKKERMERLIASIDDILKGENKMDFTIFTKTEVEEMFQTMLEHMPENMRNIAIKEFGSIEQWKKHYMEVVSSEEMQKGYLNGMLTNEQVIDEMMKLAKQIAAAHNEGKELGLTADELAFYDALTKPQAIKDFYENDELIAITKELAETLRKNRTIDWNRREQARARMRMLIKRLLKKHKYPPEGMDDAVQTVMTQCELWTDNMEG